MGKEMTVQELIDKLLLLPKDLPVYVDAVAGLTFPEVSECCLETDEGDVECVVLFPDTGPENLLDLPCPNGVYAKLPEVRNA